MTSRLILLLLAMTVSVAEAQEDPMIFNHFKAERLEYEGNENLSLFKWDVQNWIGNDKHKLWLKTEGDYVSEQNIFGRADLQLLYSRNISTFWDFQIGARRAFEPERTYDAVIGFQGLAPYFIEVESAMFITDNGNVLGRLGLGYELLLTQRLILQPRIEVNVAANDIKNRGVKSGVTEFETGMRLRYEIEREFAPYLGFDYVEEESLLEHHHSVRFVVGMRVWY
ncbi:MAG: copper resistance protein B [Methylococcaceae bacterium]|jgi:copper resistance protein B|nr:copper resistance protein B [Methylococcaceae bacterium]MDZ4155223.1 copper resistance protein B [Methylococcales bacterium]MDP2393505.1 copper resistance protein B [Methylococcaceae bacterium]MDP3021375.1 copper resistance protein B [Methylococcaceae bacterium]MDP3391034.1 copper resistance protein B [Methylococcaceae bacterium]